MRRRKIKVFLAILLFASSCIRIPEEDLVQPATSAGLDSSVEQAIESGVFAMGDWPHREWWKELGDPVLTHLIEESLENNPNLEAAEMSMRAATELAMQKRAALFPEIDLSITDDWQHLSRQGFFRAFTPIIPSVVNDFNFHFTFEYEIDFWGKNRDLFKAALGEAKAAAAEKLQVELLLTTSVAYEYAQLQFFLREKQILEEQDANRRAILGIRGKRTEHALDTSIQHLQSKADLLDIQASLAEIDTEIETQIHKLKVLSGLGQDAVFDIPYNPLNPLQVALPERLSLDLIARRPDLIAQKARLEAAAKRIDAAKTDFYPNVNLGAFIGLETVFLSKLFRWENYSGTLAPALNLPIFTAGRLRAQLAEKVIEFDAAVYAYNNLILLAAQQIADSLTAITYLQKEIDIRENSLQVVKKQEYLIQRRVEHALNDRIALLGIQDAVLKMELALATLEYGKQLAGILLIRALGGGYNDCP